jgi:hypothetical protein
VHSAPQFATVFMSPEVSHAGNDDPMNTFASKLGYLITCWYGGKIRGPKFKISFVSSGH